MSANVRQAREVAPSAERTVLVVEDDPQIRAALLAGLRLRGYSVLVAESAPAALRELESATPALILLDLMLPEMDGVTFARELERRGLRPGVPLILMSASIELADAASQIQAESFLQKPLRLPLLLQEVARLAGA